MLFSAFDAEQSGMQHAGFVLLLTYAVLSLPRVVLLCLYGAVTHWLTEKI